jgi:hypothetical protein
MNDNVKWSSVNNWVPIIVMVVTVAVTFGATLTRLALIEQKVEYIADSQSEMLDIFKDVEHRYGLLALDVERLKVSHGFD